MEYCITLTQEELNILSAALVELPFKMSAPLISKINKQLSEQNQNRESTEKAKEEK